jgi:deoxyribodipyrimidine photolyase-related protein
MKKIRLILGDQLNLQHSWFDTIDPSVVYAMMEVRQETDYVTHHIQKILGIFAAMRSFADSLREKGHQVAYIKINDDDNNQSIGLNLDSLIKKYDASGVSYLLPDEYRLDQTLKAYASNCQVPCNETDTEHFLCKRTELEEFFRGKKSYLMESFYRHMRKKHDILMDGDQPESGQWNHDASNRKSFPKQIAFPMRAERAHDLSKLLEEIRRSGVTTIGTVDETRFRWPISRKEALSDLDYFCNELLHSYGQFQDAMHDGTHFGFHSLLSFALNIKLISPKEVIDLVIKKWESKKNSLPFAGIEGFIRQILGWREYMRGIYWMQMPDYALVNALNHKKALPEWFWTGKTKMKCLHHAIRQSLETGYAHHIQRLMVTGNFALLAGVNPDEVDQWYLGIYVDAFEWVEITNTRGMSQFADGGIVGSKPYTSSANYINKMSNYCKSCHYDHKLKTGDRACPFNSLYWQFHARHRDLLEKNPRIGMVYRTWDKMSEEKQQAMKNQAETYLASINEL